MSENPRSPLTHMADGGLITKQMAAQLSEHPGCGYYVGVDVGRKDENSIIVIDLDKHEIIDTEGLRR